MIYRLKYAKSESNFDADFEHPTCKGDRFAFLITQGAALGYELLPLQGVWSLLAKVECKDNKKLRIIVRNRIFYKIFFTSITSEVQLKSHTQG